MMDTPLTTWLLFAGAEKHHRNAEIVTRLPDSTRLAGGHLLHVRNDGTP